MMLDVLYKEIHVTTGPIALRNVSSYQTYNHFVDFIMIMIMIKIQGWGWEAFTPVQLHTYNN